MSASKSTYLRQKIYDAVLKNTAFTGPATVYMSLHTSSPGLTGANEVSGNAYARQTITFGANSGGAGSNSSAPTFPAPTPANWGTVSHFGLWDALTVGNLLYQDALTSPIVTSVGVPVTFPAASVTAAET